MTDQRVTHLFSRTLGSKVSLFLCVCIVVILGHEEAAAENHKWLISELYTNGDGTIQFVELQDDGDNEGWQLGGTFLQSSTGGNAFLTNLPPVNTTGRRFLVGTVGYAVLAAQQGAPAPDMTLPNNFLSTFTNGNVTYSGSPDTVSYAALPTDGVTSWVRGGGNLTNSPRNIFNQTGSITAPPPSGADCDNDGILDSTEIANGAPDCNANGIPDECEADNDMDGVIDVCDDDDDNDTVPDSSDPSPFNQFVCGDSDLDSCDDCTNAGLPQPLNDGLDNDSDGLCNTGDLDDDGDGWSDIAEAQCGTSALSALSVPADLDGDLICDPLDPDDDGDGFTDVMEGQCFSDPLDATSVPDDFDGDMICDLLDNDDDGDGAFDAQEVQCGSDPLNAQSVPLDTDSDLICDGVDPDDDGDGVLDGADSAPLNASVCSDIDMDGCDDCSNGAFNVNDDGTDTDGDGLCDLGDTDDDNDTVADTSDSAPLNANVCRDADLDGCDDCSSGTDNPTSDGTDTDSDGLCDLGDTDDDNDTVADTSDSDPLNPFACADSDGDSCDDCSQVGTPVTANDGTDTDADGLCDLGDSDDDNDGVLDAQDNAPLNASSCADSDGDSCDDCSVAGMSAPTNDGTDTDNDGLCDLGDSDDDNDGVLDAQDSAPLNASICADSDGDGCDDCSVAGTSSPANDGTDTDADGLCDLGDPDDDNDGALDAADSNDTDPNICSDTDMDGCDDCSSGTFNPAADGVDTDNDGLCDLGDPDSDNDTVADVDDSAPLNPNICRDADLDGCDDCTSGTDAPANDGLDSDSDGLCDLGDTDDDNDGVLDGADSAPLDPFSCADSDSDGCDDCSIAGTSSPANDGTDSDADGLCDLGDTDDDNDGVLDATDSAPLDNTVCSDDDMDGCDDCTSGTYDLANDGADTDMDGLCDSGDPDVDGDSIPNECDIDQSAGDDCNSNGTLDSCDLAGGGIADCNQNGIPDSCDIAAGTLDSDMNGVPDSCETTFFVRGDTNFDGSIDITDAIVAIMALFVPGAPTPDCEMAHDANDDDVRDLADAIYLLHSIFEGGPAPLAPFPECAPDPDFSNSLLTCTTAPSCP